MATRCALRCLSHPSRGAPMRPANERCLRRWVCAGGTFRSTRPPGDAERTRVKSLHSLYRKSFYTGFYTNWDTTAHRSHLRCFSVLEARSASRRSRARSAERTRRSSCSVRADSPVKRNQIAVPSISKRNTCPSSSTCPVACSSPTAAPRTRRRRTRLQPVQPLRRTGKQIVVRRAGRPAAVRPPHQRNRPPESRQ